MQCIPPLFGLICATCQLTCGRRRRQLQQPQNSARAAAAAAAAATIIKINCAGSTVRAES